MNALGLSSISSIKGFVEAGEGMAWMTTLAGKIAWTQEGAFIETADQKLELNGELVDYVREHGITWDSVSAGTKTNSADFLRLHSKTGLFRAWSEPTQSGRRYTVLVDYQDYAEMVLTNPDTKSMVIESFNREMAHLFLTGSQSEDPGIVIEERIERVMYRFGIPPDKIGFLYDHIKAVASGVAPAKPTKEKKWWQFWRF